MSQKSLELAKLCIEYFTNTNAAGEYVGEQEDWFLKYDYLIESAMLKLARDVLQEEEMREWNL